MKHLSTVGIAFQPDPSLVAAIRGADGKSPHAGSEVVSASTTAGPSQQNLTSAVEMVSGPDFSGTIVSTPDSLPQLRVVSSGSDLEQVLERLYPEESPTHDTLSGGRDSTPIGDSDTVQLSLDRTIPLILPTEV